MVFDFSGKKFLVTGAGRGLGRAIVTALAESGATVYALSRAQETQDSLVQQNSSIIPIVQDLKDWDKTREKLEELETLDGLVNNAGLVGVMFPALEFEKETLDNYMQINTLATVNCIQVVAKKMVRDGKQCSIVNVSSVLSSLAYPRGLGYTMSKACVDMVTKQFALELGPHNIRVNSVNPTIVYTDTVQRAEAAKPDALKMFKERMPISRAAAMEEVVDPVMYLLSDRASMVTGTCLQVDGGLSCNITTKA